MNHDSNKLYQMSATKQVFTDSAPFCDLFVNGIHNNNADYQT